jgi:hypothetical protein
MKKRLLGATVLLGVSGTLLGLNSDVSGAAQRTCRVEGVWERVATVQSGKRTEFTGGRQRKLVTKKHHMWLSAENARDTLPLRTAADSSRFYWVNGGSGTYQLAGNLYTENLDLFSDPRLQGKSLKARCRTEGNMWYHTFVASDLDIPAPGAARASADSTMEIWRRVD